MRSSIPGSSWEEFRGPSLVMYEYVDTVATFYFHPEMSLKKFVSLGAHLLLREGQHALLPIFLFCIFGLGGLEDFSPVSQHWHKYV